MQLKCAHHRSMMDIAADEYYRRAAATFVRSFVQDPSLSKRWLVLSISVGRIGRDRVQFFVPILGISYGLFRLSNMML